MWYFKLMNLQGTFTHPATWRVSAVGFLPLLIWCFRSFLVPPWTRKGLWSCQHKSFRSDFSSHKCQPVPLSVDGAFHGAAWSSSWSTVFSSAVPYQPSTARGTRVTAHLTGPSTWCIHRRFSFHPVLCLWHSLILALPLLLLLQPQGAGLWVGSCVHCEEYSYLDIRGIYPLM